MRESKKKSRAHTPGMGSAPPVSKLPREEPLLRPLARAGEPDTAAGLITAEERHQDTLYLLSTGTVTTVKASEDTVYLYYANYTHCRYLSWLLSPYSFNKAFRVAPLHSLGTGQDIFKLHKSCTWPMILLCIIV